MKPSDQLRAGRAELRLVGTAAIEPKPKPKPIAVLRREADACLIRLRNMTGAADRKELARLVASMNEITTGL